MRKHKLFFALAMAFAVSMVGMLAACESGETSQTLGISPSSTVYVAGQTGDLKLALTGAQTIDSLKANGTVVAPQHYSLESGSLILDADYLSSLALGEHEFVCTSGKAQGTFQVKCYRLPSVSPEEAEYDWVNPADVNFNVDLGGASLTGVVLCGESLQSSDYVFSNGVLTIKERAVEAYCSDGDNAGSLSTELGSAQFTVRCIYSLIEATFDSSSYRLQTEAGKDVSFVFDAADQSFTLEVKNGSDYRALESAHYTYDESEKLLTVLGSYLDTLYADIYAFRLSVEDDVDSVFDFHIAAYGKESSAHPVLPGSDLAMNNFDALPEGGSFGGTNVVTDTFWTQGATNEIVEDEAIDGRSLKFTSIHGPNIIWNTIFGVNHNFEKDTLYRVAMKVRLTTAPDAASPSLAFRFMKSGEEVWGLLVDWKPGQYEFALSQKSDTRTSFSYDEETGVLSVEIYMTPTADGMNFTLTAVNAGKASIVIDDMTFLKTDMPASLNGGIGEASYVKKEGGDCEIALEIPDKMTVTAVSVDGTPLKATEYTLSDSLILSEAFLSELTGGEHSVTVAAEFISDRYGAKQQKDFIGKLIIYVVTPASLTGTALQKQTETQAALVWSVNPGTYIFSAVEYQGQRLPAGSYSFDGEKLTLSAEYLSSLGAGLHRFNAVFAEEQADDVVLVLEAGVYGNEQVHLAEDAGLFTFLDYEIGTLGKDIYGSSSVNSWDSTDANSIKVAADSVFGRALNVPNGSKAGFLSFNALKSDVVYCLRLTFRTENDEAVKNFLWKWQSHNSTVASIDSSWIENDAIKASTDFRTTLTQNPDTKVYTWTSWLPKKPESGAQLFLWPVTPQGFSIGSIELFETTSEMASRRVWSETYNYADYTQKGNFVNTSVVSFEDAENDLFVVQHLNDQKVDGVAQFDEWWILDGDRALEAGTDYIRSGYSITIKKAFLATVEDSKTLTICRGNAKVFDLNGQLICQTATLTLQKQNQSA